MEVGLQELAYLTNHRCQTSPEKLGAARIPVLAWQLLPGLPCCRARNCHKKPSLFDRLNHINWSPSNHASEAEGHISCFGGRQGIEVVNHPNLSNSWLRENLHQTEFPQPARQICS